MYGLSQAIQKRPLLRALMTDNGSAMMTEEVLQLRRAPPDQELASRTLHRSPIRAPLELFERIAARQVSSRNQPQSTSERWNDLSSERAVRDSGVAS
jgi:hypothetical protein